MAKSDLPDNVNLYEILGIDSSASFEVINKSYKNLCRIHHPDKTGGIRDKYDEIRIAHDILTDKDRKRRYDKFGYAKMDTDDAISRDMYEQMTGSNLTGQYSEEIVDDGSVRLAPPDIKLTIHLTFSELYFGKSLSKEINYQKICFGCSGIGYLGEKCSDCGGLGKIIKNIKLGSISHQTSTSCTKCYEKRRGIDDELGNKMLVCKECDGIGYLLDNKIVFVDIPAGAYDDFIYEIKEKGNERPGIEPGNIIFNISTDYKSYLREMDDLHINKCINIIQATMGAIVYINHPSCNNLAVYLPACLGNKIIQSGDTFKLPNYGILKTIKTNCGQVAMNTYGDLYIHVIVKINGPDVIQLSEMVSMQKKHDPTANVINYQTAMFFEKNN